MNIGNTSHRVGLALGSGGPRGLAHIGVLRALIEHGIPIDCIAGSSAGALIGGFFAATLSIDLVEKQAMTFTYKDLLLVFSDIGVFTGMVHGNAMEAFLDKLLEHKTIESLGIPFAAVATDVYAGDTVALTHGNLARSIRMSSSVPALFDAALHDGRYMIDGGTSHPVPVHTTRDMGATYVIAVNLDSYNFIDSDASVTKMPNIKDVSIASIRLLRYNLAKELCRHADTTIIPDVSSVSSINLAEFLRPTEIIKKGYEAAIASIPQIKSDLNLR